MNKVLEMFLSFTHHKKTSAQLITWLLGTHLITQPLYSSMASHCPFPMYVVAVGARKIISSKKEEKR